jgi:hypothetical protein
MRTLGSVLILAILWMISLRSASVFAKTTHRIQLPHPSGSYGVARVGYDWVDQARPERYAEDSTARREIMVYVWYPADLGSGSRVPSEYLPHADAIAKSLDEVPGKIEEFWGNSWASIFSGKVPGDTYGQAPISPGTERFPVLIFAPGFATPSTSYTALIEEVVSQALLLPPLNQLTMLLRLLFLTDELSLLKRSGSRARNLHHRERPGNNSSTGSAHSMYLMWRRGLLTSAL